MGRIGWLLPGAVLLAALVGLGLFALRGGDGGRAPPVVALAHEPELDSAPPSAAPREALRAEAEPDLAAGAATPRSSRAALPASLAGTEVDGSLEVDAAGHFLPTPDARRLFEYFLSAVGEEPPEAIRGRILLRIESLLPAAAAEEAAAVLDDYLALREALAELEGAGLAPDSLERRWQWIRELRREYLGADVAAGFFAEEEQVTLRELERRAVLSDEALTTAEREARLAAIEARLPEDVRAARARATAPLRARREVEALRAGGAGEDEILAARARHFGPAAAERLAELDRRRAEWVGRLAAYADARDALLREVPAEQRATALAALRASHFDADEIPRVRALERNGALRGATSPRPDR